MIGGNETQLIKQNKSDDDTLLNLFMIKTIEWYAISVAESRISDVTYIKWEWWHTWWVSHLQASQTGTQVPTPVTIYDLPFTSVTSISSPMATIVSCA